MPTINTQEAAKRLGVNPSRVRQLILAGRLRAKKIGRDWLVESADLAAVKQRFPGRPKKKA